MAIAQGLDVPLRDRNALLLAAGYAPLYSEGAWNAPEMQSITKALERILRQHEPFPAIVMDRYWNVLMTSEAAPDFFNRALSIWPGASRARATCCISCSIQKGMRPFAIANWEELAKSLFERVYREAVGRVLDEKTRDLMRALQAYPDVKTEWKNLEVEGAAPAMPIIPVSFVKDGHVLNYFSMVTTVGTPKTIAAQELRIECMFPADDATETLHIRMMNR